MGKKETDKKGKTVCVTEDGEEQESKREKLTPNFYRDEFECRCGCGEDSIEWRLVNTLQSVRDEYESPMKITSGVRCPTHNSSQKVNGGQFSAHLYGFAADIYCKDSYLRYRLLPILFKHFKRVGVYKDFFHVDIDTMKANPVCW